MVGEVERRTETARRILVSKRNHRRVRDRALTRLARAHKEEYLQLLEREKARDEETGKRWLDIAGNTGSVESYKDAIEGAVDPSDERENPSYYGGEE
jgi:hypothetical protein